MKSDFEILVDSGSDLTPEFAKSIGVSVFPLSFALDDNQSVKANKVDLKELYSYMRNGGGVTTVSAVLSELCAVIDKRAAFGHDVMYISFSTELSNTAGTSRLAVEEVSKRYPDRTIITVDSLCVSGGYGLLAYLAAKQRDEGKSITETAEYLNTIKYSVCNVLCADTLKYLKSYGNISVKDAAIGTVLSKKPLLRLDDSGALEVTRYVTGKKTALNAIADEVAEKAVRPEEQTIFIRHADAEKDAEYLREQIEKKIKVGAFQSAYIGPVSGGHIGPGTVAVFYIGGKR